MRNKLCKYLGIIVIGSLVLLWIGCSNTSEIVSPMDSGQGEVPYNEYTDNESQQTDEGGTSEYSDGNGNNTYDGRGTTIDSDNNIIEQDEY